MLTKIAFTATAAAVLLSTASTTFAASKNQRVPEQAYFSESLANPKARGPTNQRIPEPLYFKHATGEEG
jgi:hypothetical protein